MRVIHTIAELRSALAGAPRCAFVPTMGNLHAGHISLIQLAKERGGNPVVASIFVNRLQFAPHEDFDRYPRTLERDAALLREAGCDMVFAPSEAELYPQPQGYQVTPPAELAGILEGEFRPGFFTGVCTVVLKLFNLVQPQLAVFGKKDYQQWMVIRGMVRQLGLPIEIIGGETGRADDGLALSSRNGYLSAEERLRAVQLWRSLQQLAQALAAGRGAASGIDLAAAQAQGLQQLRDLGWAPDYLSVRRRSDLLLPTPEQIRAAEPLVALVAARIGQTRLIDNLEC